jgi:hypothetical protein
VSLEIYYQPGHEFDLNRMMDGMKATLEYCSNNFSRFQFHQERIIEFPRYGTFAESFPNTIPYSEAIGFITYVDSKDLEAIDIPFYVTAHEVGHQWWAHQIISANVEGGTSIVETLAQYTALMVMKHRYGDRYMRKFLRYELENYLRGRAQERNEEEPPLYKVDENQGYIPVPPPNRRNWQLGTEADSLLFLLLPCQQPVNGLAELAADGKQHGRALPPFPPGGNSARISAARKESLWQRTRLIH